MRLIPEGLLHELTGRDGDIPQAGRDRWGKAKRLKPGESYTFINTVMRDIVCPMALQIAFSIDGKNFTPNVPTFAPNNVQVDVLKAVDVKSGAFNETTVLNPGDALPFCSLIAKALTVNITNLTETVGSDIYVHAVACPTTMVDCGSITNDVNSPWNDVISIAYAANTVGVFNPLIPFSTSKQTIIQNNTAVPLYLGFGSFIPNPGPPPFSNMVLPGGINAIWESQLGAFIGAVNAAFGPGGVGTEYATFSRGI